MRYWSFILAGLFFLSCSGNKTEQNQGGDSPAPAIPKTVQVAAATTASINNILNAYDQLKNALVEYDTVAANKAAGSLSIAADSVSTKDITDSTLAVTLQNLFGSISAEAKALAGEKDLIEKKRSFSMIGENLYPILESVQYNEAVIYRQMCPMAFNENEVAYWISKEREVVNPYLGKKHPKYSSGMLHCGEVKDSIAYAK